MEYCWREGNIGPWAYAKWRGAWMERGRGETGQSLQIVSVKVTEVKKGRGSETVEELEIRREKKKGFFS